MVVTGATSGIGEATARLLAREGFVVYAGYRKATDRDKIAAYHANVRPVVMDVADDSTLQSSAREVRRGGLALRGLVNNAGVALGGPLEFVPIDEMRKLFDVNVFGAIATSQAFLPQLRQSKGRIVFVGSVSGRLTSPFAGPYSASKFALRAFSDALRMELRNAGVAVALIEPGSVKTPIWRKATAASTEALQQRGAEVSASYGGEMDAALANAEREERGGMSAEVVAWAIDHALTSRRPRENYFVGSKVASIFAVLPTPVRDRLLLAAMRRRGR